MLEKERFWPYQNAVFHFFLLQNRHIDRYQENWILKMPYPLREKQHLWLQFLTTTPSHLLVRTFKSHRDSSTRLVQGMPNIWVSSALLLPPSTWVTQEGVVFSHLYTSQKMWAWTELSFFHRIMFTFSSLHFHVT